MRMRMVDEDVSMRADARYVDERRYTHALMRARMDADDVDQT